MEKLIKFLLILVLVGCATSPKTDDTFGPPAPTPPPTQEKLVEINKEKIALVIGGAGVASFATAGLLKGLEQEGIKPDFIIATGWPALFGLAYTYVKSLHDLDWFTMRLEKNLFWSGRTPLSEQKFSDTLIKYLQKQFANQDLRQTKIPLILSTTNTLELKPRYIEEGSWKNPLFQSMSVPALHPAYTVGSSSWVSSTEGLDVEEATQRKADVILAVSMYDEYMGYLATEENEENVFRILYATRFRDNIQQALKKATFAHSIRIQKSPLDFEGKKRAIEEGKKAAVQIANQLRSRVE